MSVEIDRGAHQMRSLAETSQRRRIDLVAGFTQKPRDRFVTPAAMPCSVNQDECTHRGCPLGSGCSTVRAPIVAHYKTSFAHLASGSLRGTLECTQAEVDVRTLVTGGAGFLGSHLCERLLKDGHEVICLDNFFSGKRSNISHLIGERNFELIRHDTVEPILVEVDRIFHLACPASPVHYQYNPVKTIKTSVMGTINMLGLAKRVHARILLTSTSEVYGHPEQHPQTESDWGHVNPIGVRSCYDEGKRVAECLMMDYHRQNNIDIKIVRIFNTYGPRMAINDGRVVSNFCVAALRGEDLEIYGDGKQTRSFAYVDDIIDALVRMMNQDSHIGPVNIGNPDEFTIAELAKLAIELASSSSKVVIKNPRADDPVRRKPNIDLAKKVLGWEPHIALRPGLEKTIAHFREVLGITRK